MPVGRNLVALVLLALGLARLGPGQSVETIVVQALRDGDGLRGAAVMTTMIDSLGRAWIGTDSGLNRLDSSDLTAIETGRDLVLVSALLEHPRGVVWVGHAGGLGRIVDEVFSSVPLPLATDQVRGNDRVVALAKMGDAVIVGSHAGLFRADREGRVERIEFDLGNEWQRSARVTFCLTESRRHGLLAGTAAGTFVVNEQGPPTLLFRLAGLDVTFGLRSSRAMQELADGRIVVSNSVQTLVFDVESGLLEPLVTRAHPEGQIPGALCFGLSGDGMLWVCSSSGRLLRWNPRDDELHFHDFQIANLPSRPARVPVFHLLRSEGGVTWLSTPEGLLYFSEEPALPVLHLPQDRDGDGQRAVLHLVVDGAGRSWIAAASDGLQRMDPDGSIHVVDLPGGLRGEILVLRPDLEGRVVGLTAAGGVFRSDGEQVAAVEIPDLGLPSGTRIRDLLLRPDGSLLLATDLGLAEVDRSGEFRELVHGNDLPSSGPFLIETGGLDQDAAGNVWMFTGAGLFRGDSSGRNHRYGSSGGDDVEVRLPGDLALAHAHAGPGRVILSQSGRLGLLDHESGTHRPLNVVEHTGRRMGFIRDLAFDSAGRLWALSLSSLFHVDVERGVARKVSLQLASSNLVASRLSRGPGDSIHLTNGAGFFRLDPADLLRPRRSPVPVLSELEILGDSFRPESLESPLVLPEDHNRFSFGITGNELLYRNDLRFSLRLTGADENWQELGNDGRIHYAGLSSGRYRLEARAESGGGEWSAPVLLLEFELRPPIWKSLPFQVGAATLVVLLLVLGFRRQVALERRRAENLEKVVAERTESLRTKSGELERLYTVVRNINAATTLQDLLRRTLDESIAALEADAGRFYLKTGDRWRLGVAVGWEPIPGAEPSKALLDRLAVAGADRPIDEIVEDPGDVHDPADGAGRCCSLVMLLHHDVGIDACMMLDFRQGMSPADENHLKLFQRLYQPVTLAYRKLRLLEKAEALNDRKNELLGAAAHDLRNPITVIGMTAEMLQTESGHRDGPQGDGQKREIEMIARATRRMATMVDKLLDISAIESGRVEIELVDSDLHHIAAERVEFFEKLAQARRIGLRLELSDEDSPVRIDVERVGSALDNLLSNALKYTPTGGNVVVSCRRRGDEVEVEVRDNGQGLPPQEAAELFRNFRRMSARPEHGEVASGLGLAIVKRIIELHDGRVFAESELGKGSRFGFALPIRQTPTPV